MHDEQNGKNVKGELFINEQISIGHVWSSLMKTSAIVSLFGTLAVALISGAYLVQTSRIQMEQTKVSISATSSLSILNQQAERMAPFFLVIDQLDMTGSQKDVTLKQLNEIAHSVKIESAKLRPFLSDNLAAMVWDIGNDFYKLSDSVREDKSVKEAIDKLYADKQKFIGTYYVEREAMLCIAFPSDPRGGCKNAQQAQ